MKKLIVLDFLENKVFIYNYDENIWKSPEDFSDENDNLVIHSNCYYMVVDKVNIEIK